MYPNWKQNFLAKRPIRRYSFDPDKNYTLPELQQIYSSITLGNNRITRINKPELRTLIVKELKRQEEEKHVVTVESKYRRETSQPVSRKTIVTFYDVPADAKEIANVVNEAIISVGKDEVHDLYLSINAEFETSYFKRNPNMTLSESREKHAGIPVEYRRYKSKYEEKLRDSASERRIEKPIEYKYEEEDRPIRPTQPIEANKYSETRRTNEHIAFPLTSNRVEISTIREWLHNIEESIDKNLEKSDEYIELEHITVLKVEIRKLIKKGGAYVFLKHPDKHPDIYCPEGDADCAFLILSYLNLLNFKDHQTIHQVKQNHLIPPFVSMRHLESISRELTTPVQFVVHKVQDNGFFTTNLMNWIEDLIKIYQNMQFVFTLDT